MSLNPVQFGTHVVDQFGRYLMTTFPIADTRIEEQVKHHLRHELGGERLIAKGPYVYLNRPFEQGPSVAEMAQDAGLGLHPALQQIFPFESVHKHQEIALRQVKAGKHTVVATGTGSGKTESFLLPIVDHCLHLRDEKAPRGIVAVLIYPMNALVDDQLRRLRQLLAGTRITFGRYTGATPDTKMDSVQQLGESRAYTKEELGLLAAGRDGEVALPWEECASRSEIQERRPRLILTNYAQLEYLLLRDKDLGMFREAQLRFVVFDELHTYTGGLGSEVACLIRRLRHVTGKSASEVIHIGTSATVQESGGFGQANQATLGFARRFLGVPEGSIELVTEHYRTEILPEGETYVPPAPKGTMGLLASILEQSRDLHLSSEVVDIPEGLFGAIERLCGRDAPEGGDNLERAYRLLKANRIVSILGQLFKEPKLITDALSRLRSLGRRDVSDADLVAEVLCYLTVGALVHEDGEPLLRPKLHYFVQGYQGLTCSFDEKGQPRVHFDPEGGGDGGLGFALVLCRSCGQHYFALYASEPVAHDDGQAVTGVRLTRPAGRQSTAQEDESLVYITDRLATLAETNEGETTLPNPAYLCRVCGALHDGPSEQCLNGRCSSKGSLIEVTEHKGEMKTCISCGTWAKGYEEIVTPARSSEVADVTILAQSMLAAMAEESLQKLLIFSDNRQDAAFQAGWMDERSRRYRLRHLLYSVLESEKDRVWSMAKLTEKLVDEANVQGVLKPGVWEDEDNQMRVRWFLLEEFASTGQRRSSLETLALAEVLTAGAGAGDLPGFYETWTQKLGIESGELENLIRLILDYYRRRGMVSDPLMQRRWSDMDREVRQGIVHTHAQYRPQALVFEKKGGAYTKGFVARNGRSSAQVMVKKAVPRELDSSLRDEFLEELWTALTTEQVLVEATLVIKKAGKNVPLRGVAGSPYQINVDNLGFRVAYRRELCMSCRMAQSVPLPTGACPEYGCKGETQPDDRDDEHYDVVQYTRTRFVPLKTWEHSAQVPKNERQVIEQEFKKEKGGKYNCLVCTPTLELGVDIGKLEMVLMRNVPPTPANYSQRAGRAGRRHRIAVVFTYCRGSSHGRYFFDDPTAMISGEIRVPAFSLRNEPCIRKHVHSTVLTALRELATDREKEILERTFPPFVWAYFSERFPVEEGKWRHRYFDAPPSMDEFEGLVRAHRDELLSALQSVFTGSWPAQDAEAVSRDVLEQLLDQMPENLRRHVKRIFAKVQSCRKELAKLRGVEDDGISLTEEDEKNRKRYQYALRALGSQDRLENYTLSYLGVDGFFPGYALARESVTAQSLSPYMELNRPCTTALRELTPANFVYANKNIFRVRKLNFYQAQSDEAEAAYRRELAYDLDHSRVFDPTEQASEGGHETAPLKISSFRLLDVEMRQQQDINDREKARRLVPFDMQGITLSEHGGGKQGSIGQHSYRFYRRQHLRLVNLGLPGKTDKPFSLFPLCPVCGASRSPRATEPELERFREAHMKTCSVEPGFFALHVDLISDVLHLGPFPDGRQAANVYEAVRIGARYVLDMGESEVEGFDELDEHGTHWAVIYEPIPGGAGFLPQILEYWETICDRAMNALANCPSKCDSACYSCMKHFRNQQYHDVLDRHDAQNLLMELRKAPQFQHEIGAVIQQPTITGETADSGSEEEFVQICKDRGFPVPPRAQYSVDLGAGSYTVADFAYPDRKVLVYIDGMSAGIHGNPEQQRKDKLQRAKAEMKGFRVVSITAQGLTDDASLGEMFDRLALFLTEYQ